MMSSVGGMTVDKLVDASRYADFERQFPPGDVIVFDEIYLNGLRALNEFRDFVQTLRH